MRNLKDAKNIYDHIVVPEELDERLRSALETAPKTKFHKKGRLVYFSKWAAASAAALFLCFTVGVNTSESFAMGVSEMPILGTIAKVLTIHSYETVEDTTTTKVTIPEVQVETADKEVEKAITDVNAEIQKIVAEFTTEKQAEAAEYKEAFFATGGTEEEWGDRDIDINVDYEVKCQNDSILSLLLDGWMSSVNFQEERHFYNIDLVTGKELTLTDLLGEDAYTYASENVKSQMEERVAEDPEGLIYWGINDNSEEFEDVEGFAFPGVTETTPFYINEDGNVVISYNKYDAAPGYMGIQEFVIPAR